MLQDFGETIKKVVNFQVEQANTITCYRKPLIGFASAYDPLFDEIKNIVGQHHLHPTDLLSDAKTVVAFFIPFAEEVIRANRKSAYVAPEWSIAYVETNMLIEKINVKLTDALTEYGVKAVSQKPTDNFDENNLTASWSHKSAAYIAGLGTFGLNKMLITSAGCAGRLGSMVISEEIPATPRPSEEYCQFFKNGKCKYCVIKCPSRALTTHGMDKQKCWNYLLDKRDPDLDRGCGKCAVGPCALKPF